MNNPHTPAHMPKWNKVQAKPFGSRDMTYAIQTEDGMHICDVNSYGASPEQRSEHADLIASSPALRAALEEIQSMLKPYVSGDDLCAKVSLIATKALA